MGKLWMALAAIVASSPAQAAITVVNGSGYLNTFYNTGPSGSGGAQPTFQSFSFAIRYDTTTNEAFFTGTSPYFSQQMNETQHHGSGYAYVDGAGDVHFSAFEASSNALSISGILDLGAPLPDSVTPVAVSLDGGTLDVGIRFGTFTGVVTSAFVASDPSAQAVPEPATWLTMLVGLGAAGAALRRRRSKSALAPS